MTTQIFLLVLCFIVIALLIVFRKTSFVKKYWRYSLILIPAILLIVFKIMLILKDKSTGNTPSVNLGNEVSNIKGQLGEVNTVVQIEAAIAKTNDQQKIDQLKQIQQIADDDERRKQLAAMIG